MQTTMSFQLGDKRYDLMLDDQQTIAQGLAVLRDAGRISAVQANYYRAHCSRKVVSAYQPLSELGLYSGELLEAIQ